MMNVKVEMYGPSRGIMYISYQQQYHQFLIKTAIAKNIGGRELVKM